jgi:integrase/recombinase XerD
MLDKGGYLALKQADAGWRAEGETTTELVTVSATAGNLVVGSDGGPPAIVTDAGSAAVFVWEEFFSGEIRNSHTRKAYRHAVRRFLGWCEARGVELARITPGMVGQYMDELPGSAPTKKQDLAAIRGLFDKMVTRHVVLLNPAASVRGERYQVIEGKTPEITPAQARALLSSVSTNQVVGLRDRDIVGVMIYTAARVGAIAKLQLKHLVHDGSQYCLRFDEKGGKSRLIPVRHDLEGFVLEYLDAAGLRDAKDGPLFRTALRKTKKLTGSAMSATGMRRMVKRRMRDAELPPRLSLHSFRVATLTNLLEQGVAQEDVQYLAGHADARTTRLYDRRQKRVTRNIVERISI